MNDAMSPPASTTSICPQCQREIPSTSKYVVWCPNCEWNIQPEKINTKPRTLFERIISTISQRNSEHLFNLVLASNAQKPSLTLSTLCAFVIACGIYLASLVILCAGVALIVIGRANIFALIGGILLLLMCWVVRPRIASAPAKLLTRNQAPTLYAQIDQISQALGIKPVSGIIVTAEFNAAYGTRGWLHKHYLWLGLPLWAVLEPQEQVALLAHELAHGANGDPSRSIFLGRALEMLGEWHAIVRPRTLLDSDQIVHSLFAIPFRLLALLLSWCLHMLLLLFALLLWRTMQCAEYWADNVSSQLSGTAAALSLLEKLHLNQSVSLIIERASWKRYATNARAFVHDIRQTVAALPAHEKERLRRINQRADSRIDTSHPPTKYRIEYLLAHVHGSARFNNSPEQAERMLNELMSVW